MTVREAVELILNLRVNVFLLLICVFWIVTGFFSRLGENLWRDFDKYMKQKKDKGN